MRPRLALVSLALAGCVGGDLTIVTTDLDGGRVRLPYRALLEVEGAGGPVVWWRSAGELPPGLILAGDGSLSGAPTRPGTFTFEVTADDGAVVDSIELSIQVPPVLLLSGFGPFAGYPVNPSIEALRPLDRELLGGYDLRVVELPVEWDVSWTLLEAAIDELAPTVAIGTGVAGSNSMRYETSAQNVEEGRDVAGVRRDGEPIVEGGPATLPSELPVAQMRDAVSAAGYPTSISDDAGTYLCNYVFYHLVDRARGDEALLAGFVHVPPAPTDAFQIEDITAAHRVGLEAFASGLWMDRASRPVVPDLHEAPDYGPPHRDAAGEAASSAAGEAESGAAGEEASGAAGAAASQAVR